MEVVQLIFSSNNCIHNKARLFNSSQQGICIFVNINELLPIIKQYIYVGNYFTLLNTFDIKLRNTHINMNKNDF